MKCRLGYSVYSVQFAPEELILAKACQPRPHGDATIILPVQRILRPGGRLQDVLPTPNLSRLSHVAARWGPGRKASNPRREDRSARRATQGVPESPVSPILQSCNLVVSGAQAVSAMLPGGTPPPTRLGIREYLVIDKGPDGAGVGED